MEGLSVVHRHETLSASFSVMKQKTSWGEGQPPGPRKRCSALDGGRSKSCLPLHWMGWASSVGRGSGNSHPRPSLTLTREDLAVRSAEKASCLRPRCRPKTDPSKRRETSLNPACRVCNHRQPSGEGQESSSLCSRSSGETELRAQCKDGRKSHNVAGPE